MAEGYLRRDLLRLPPSTELHIPDFTRLLNDTKCTERSEEDRAWSAVRDLEAFRIISEEHGFSPLLIELAIFDDDLLQLAMDSSERVGSDRPEDLQFLSVSASYNQFADSPALLHAWHRASRLVVSKDKESIVGEKGTYSYAYLWDYLSAEGIAFPDPIADEFECQDRQYPPPESILVDLPEGRRKANVVPPVAYSLGKETIGRITSAWNTTKIARPQVEPSSLLEPRSITHNLLSYVAAAAQYDNNTDVSFTLTRTVLFVLPFTRPWLYSAENPSKSVYPESTSRPGGGLFMLCELPEGTDQGDLLDSRLTALSSALDYVVFQAGMLEARQQRFLSRETDVSLFKHSLRGPIQTATTDCSVALTTAERTPGLDPSIVKYLKTAFQSVKRLEQVGNVARTAVLMRSGKATSYSFSSTSIDSDLFREKITNFSGSALESARDSIRDPRIAKAVDRVTHEIIWKPDRPFSVNTDDNYLRMLLDELLSNALLHGNFAKSQSMRATVFLDAGGYAWIAIENPISGDERQALKDTLSRKRLLLGLTQIDLLARTYSVPPPKFQIKDESFEVTCALAKVTLADIGPTALESR